MKKITPTNYTHNDAENEVIEIYTITKDNQSYYCVGALVEENSDVLKIAFSARNNIIHDYLEIKKEYIKNIRFIREEDINKIE